jgi:hypothetical protein
MIKYFNKNPSPCQQNENNFSSKVLVGNAKKTFGRIYRAKYGINNPALASYKRRENITEERKGNRSITMLFSYSL